jgi:hypothetical protein
MDILVMFPFSWTLSPLYTVYGFIFWVEEERLSEHEYRQDGSHLSMQAKENKQYKKTKQNIYQRHRCKSDLMPTSWT